MASLLIQGLLRSNVAKMVEKSHAEALPSKKISKQLVADCHKLYQQLPPAAQNSFTAAFKKLDADEIGNISEEELRVKYLQSKGIEESTEILEMLAVAIAVCETDRSGELSFFECWALFTLLETGIGDCSVCQRYLVLDAAFLAWAACWELFRTACNDEEGQGFGCVHKCDGGKDGPFIICFSCAKPKGHWLPPLGRGGLRPGHGTHFVHVHNTKQNDHAT